MMMKLTPGVNFINILHAHFCTDVLCSTFFYLHVTREKLNKTLLYEKGARKMLMKLTPVWNGDAQMKTMANATDQ